MMSQRYDGRDENYKKDRDGNTPRQGESLPRQGGGYGPRRSASSRPYGAAPRRSETTTHGSSAGKQTGSSRYDSGVRQPASERTSGGIGRTGGHGVSRRAPSSARSGWTGGQTRHGRFAGGTKGGRGRMPSRPFPKMDDSRLEKIPEPGENIRIIPLGGVEEIGKNMSVIEYKNDIIVIDAGFQFREEDTPGIDYILPNTKYLEERKDKVRAVLITHGHLDHIGALPYVMDKIGNPPIYARNFTTLMIKKRQEEFPHLPPIDFRVVEKGERIKIGDLSVSFFAVTHSIPDSMGIIVETPYGDIVYTGDLRLDHTEGEVSEIEGDVYNEFKNRNVLLLQTDSTNAENPGFSISEKIVERNIEAIIRDTKGRLIISTFASQVERIIKMIQMAEKYGKKVVVEGRSMKTNIEVAKVAGLLKMKPDTIIQAEEMENYPPDRIIILSTGQQGEEFAALVRISNKTHKYIKLTNRDTILLSSSVIPGNERSVQRLKDNLSRQGAHIISYKTSDIHSSGHANSEELSWIHKKIKPKFFVPIHGYHYMLTVHADIAKNTGVKPENIIVPDNGMIIEIYDKGEKIKALKEKAPSNIVMVDGFSIGDMQQVVIRDRQILSQDGIFVIVATIDLNTGRLRKSPDLISRGFIYLRESQDLLQETRLIVKHTVEESIGEMHPINFDYVKDKVTDNVARFLFQKTAKRPIVIPVILGV